MPSMLNAPCNSLHCVAIWRIEVGLIIGFDETFNRVGIDLRDTPRVGLLKRAWADQVQIAIQVVASE